MQSLNAMAMISFSEFLQSTALKAQASRDRAALPEMLSNIGLACSKIAHAIETGALQGNMGTLASENVQGETQKTLDLITNQLFLEINQASGRYAGMASEEMEAPYAVPASLQREADYLLVFDPLDGSSNVNLNFSVGTIFSILHRPQAASALTQQEFLQSGHRQLCAGYALYGTSTMLVLSLGNGVHGFTLDRASGEFMLTHPDMRIPAETQEFAINMSNQRLWEPPVQRYIAECLQGKAGPRGQDFNMRWIASMVAEVHRILIRGGVFLYPLDSRYQDKGGRLRLLYEANPMSFLVEQAGGMASTGHARILDIAPSALHQRVPVILGSRHEVERLVAYHDEAAEYLP